jgi:hypothetical protein
LSVAAVEIGDVTPVAQPSIDSQTPSGP